MSTLALAFGILLAVFLGTLEFMLLMMIWRGEIDLRLLVSEKNGTASLSRFQFLIFTFVIAMSFFLVVATDPTGLPEVPSGVFTLLGISGGSYVVSKGIHANKDRPTGGRPGDAGGTGPNAAGGGSGTA